MSEARESIEREPLMPRTPPPIQAPQSSASKCRSNFKKSPSTSALFGQSKAYEKPPELERYNSASIGLLDSLKHEGSQGYQNPFVQSLIDGHYTVTNPNPNLSSQLEYGHHNASNLHLGTPGVLESNASVYSVPDLEEQQRRLNVLNSLRPHKLVGNCSRLANWMDGYKHDTNKIRNKKVRKYYEDQNYLIERFQEIDNFLDYGKIHINMLSTYNQSEVHQEVIHEEADDDGTYGAIKTSVSTSHLSRNSRINEIPGNIETEGAQFLGYNQEQDSYDVMVAVLVNFAINFLLLIGKIVVSFLTNSISVVASLVDSALDFLSTFIIYVANKFSTTKNWQTEHAYPVGRSRLEPLGVLIFSIIIIVSFCQVGQESLKRLFFTGSEEHKVIVIGTDAIVIMAITIVSKVGCWIWCSNSKSSSVQALAQDAKTDVVFNFISLLMPTLGHYFNVWWLDPAGALLLSVYIIISWGKTAFEHIDNLTGAIANQLDYKVILYLSYRFAESIKQITALKVYHVGDNLNVEIDLVFNYDDFNLSVKDTHDLAEALQYAIETLPSVERAYVHIDYMEGNFKGHLK